MIIYKRLKQFKTHLYQSEIINFSNKSRNFILLDCCLYIAGTCLIFLYLNFLCIYEKSIAFSEFLKMRNAISYYFPSVFVCIYIIYNFKDKICLYPI